MATPEPLLDAVAGGLSGTAVDFVLFPLDTIKTRLQARRSGIVAPPKRNFYQGRTLTFGITGLRAVKGAGTPSQRRGVTPSFRR